MTSVAKPGQIFTLFLCEEEKFQEMLSKTKAKLCVCLFVWYGIVFLFLY